MRGKWLGCTSTGSVSVWRATEEVLKVTWSWWGARKVLIWYALIRVLPTQVDNTSDVRNHFNLRDKYRYFACLMRARFEEHKNEKDMMRATQLLREAEEEFWQNQHPQPYIFPDSPGGTSYERYECYKVGERTWQLLYRTPPCPWSQTSALHTMWHLSHD